MVRSMADDHVLSIQEVCRRLNKSLRTVHRYKDSGRLTAVEGLGRGRPLRFSVSEVEALAAELSAKAPPSATPERDEAFWGRVERLERVLGVLEQNPLLEAALGQVPATPAQEATPQLAELIQLLAAASAEQGPAARRQLGQLLIRLGELLARS